MFGTIARRIAEWRSKHGFITPGDFSEECEFVTEQDVRLCILADILPQLKTVIHTVNRDQDPRMWDRELEILINCLQTIRDELRDNAPKEGQVHEVTHRQIMAAKLLKFVEEVGEAANEIQQNNRPQFILELADLYIRLGDVVGTMMRRADRTEQAFSFDNVVLNVMEKNERRPIRHGRNAYL